MARTFIDDVLVSLIEKETDLSELTFVLPSKRAGQFLKSLIAEHSQKTMFSPEILSIEEFIETISLLKTRSNTELLFELYKVYLSITPEDAVHEFDAFCKWAQVMLQDFNEIDRYLVPPDRIFTYLSAIKEVDHWSLADHKTDLIKDYLSFWERLPRFYQDFKDSLIAKGIGYQGLLYREAVEKLELYTQHNQDKKHVFLGFNALNTAEQRIIQELLHQGLADIYWDFDRHFVESNFHDAGMFARQHKKWRYFERMPFNWVSDHYSGKKEVHVIGVPKNIGQVKYVGELLAQGIENPPSKAKTAVILGDEALLMPMLNSIPEEVGAVNISMGMPLGLAPMATLFEALFKLHKTGRTKKLYYKDVFAITGNPFISKALDVSEAENVVNFHSKITHNNMNFLSLDWLEQMFPSNIALVQNLFGDWKDDSQVGLEQCTSVIYHIKESLDANGREELLSLEFLYKFYKVFNQVKLLLESFDHAKNLNSLYSLYKEILASETMDFQGEPLKGLQVIGMLESRVIDFDTVIITSVNEGILPAGKSHNSFIPFDVKLDYGLPTYKEKDAVYTYHFYHLLQRAKKIYILYNTEVDAFNGGEKSRFITQLEVEDIHDIKHYLAVPEVPKAIPRKKSVFKTEDIAKSLEEMALRGFSPSSLTSYIRNPMDFYKQSILGIDTFKDVEETVAANTLGTIIHNTLEELYKPHVDVFLSIDDIENMIQAIERVVKEFFIKEFKEGDIGSGKNLIVFEIAKRYVHNFLKTEKRALLEGKKIKIVALEKKFRVPIDVQELHYPIFLKGTVDRIDECDGVLRIIDYKTGKVLQNKVEVVEWTDITTDYDKFSKSFQILAYAYMLHLAEDIQKPVEAGIISFKNLKSGFLKFAKKDKPGSRQKDHAITPETLTSFSIELKKLIIEICNQELPFTEKEV